MSWLLSPLRTACILTWRHYRLYCVVIIAAVMSLLFLGLFFYSFPSEISHKLFNPSG